MPEGEHQWLWDWGKGAWVCLRCETIVKDWFLHEPPPQTAGCPGCSTPASVKKGVEE